MYEGVYVCLLFFLHFSYFCSVFLFSFRPPLHNASQMFWVCIHFSCHLLHLPWSLERLNFGLASKHSKRREYCVKMHFEIIIMASACVLKRNIKTLYNISPWNETSVGLWKEILEQRLLTTSKTNFLLRGWVALPKEFLHQRIKRIKLDTLPECPNTKHDLRNTLRKCYLT